MPRVKRKKQKQRVRRRWPWKAIRRLAVAVSACAVLGGAGYGAYSAWQWGVAQHALLAVSGLGERMVATSARLGLTVQEISVAGRAETPAAAVLAALNAPRGMPILAFSPAAAKAALEQLPWVRDASVERRLPNAIHADLTERKPLALWQRDLHMVVIDHDGEEIRGVAPERFPDLLVLVGADAPANALSLTVLLDSEPSLRPQVDAAIRVSGRRWNVRLFNGVEVQLPELNPTAAWNRLAALEAKGKVLDGSARVIDLRLPDRMIVRMARDNAAPTPPEPQRAVRLRPPRQI